MINDVAKDIVYRFMIDSFIETGLLEGETVDIVRRWFPNLPIVGLEIDQKRAEAVRSKSSGPTTIDCGSSEKLLGWMIDSGALKGTVFAYLDAHWNAYCPLLDEIRQLLRLRKVIIAVDDFDVPGYPPEIVNPYSFEQEGRKWVCNASLFHDLIPANRLPPVRFAANLNAHQRGMGLAFVDWPDEIIDLLTTGLPIVKE